MQGGLRRGLHIDDDQEARKPDEYGGFEASRKRGNFQKNLDDMLFGGGGPAPRRKPAPPAPDANKSAEKPADSSTQKPLQPVPNKSTDTVNQSIKTQGGNQGVNTSQGSITNTKPKDTSILKSKQSDPPSKTPGTIPIISKPQIDNYVAEKPSKPAVAPQPEQQEEEVILEVVHGFSNKNKFNKPGFLRKGKKVAENFKFAEENVTHHSAVDVVRPFEVDRTRQSRLNDFDYHDHQFPATISVLGSSQKDIKVEWKKPKDIARVVNFGKYVDPNDFNAGSLSGPHFLSALSGIAQLQANTKRLIEDQQANSNGFYMIRLFVNSVWRYITVDSSLPFINGENAGVISYEGDLDLQGALIQKAYAKSFGSYNVFQKVTPRQYYLRDLTGAPVKKYSIDHPDLQNIVKKALASGQVVQAIPTDKIASLGINPNFSYSVIGFTNKGLELRNSWGTIEERSKANIKTEGNFDLPSSQLREMVSHILITCINTEYYTTTVQAGHRLGFYSTYNFKISNQTHGFLTVSQWDKRLFPQTSGYDYSPVSIILQKEQGESQVFVNANHTINGRNLDLQVNLSPGNYTVFVAFSWKYQQQSFDLSFYGSQKIDFSRVYTERDPSLIALGLQEVNLSQGRQRDLSKTIKQYISYHRESNCILITVENTSTRQGRAQIDLSRVKFDQLTLVSGYSNEDNYAEKVSSQIEDYRQIALSDKRWSVTLEGEQRFTWVLAVGESYNEGNLNVWGLN